MKLNIKPRIYYTVIVVFLILSGLFAVSMVSIFGILQDHDQTFLGTIAISNYDDAQYRNIIQSEVLEWRNDATYEVHYQNIVYELPLESLELEMDETINQLQPNTLNRLVYTISTTTLATIEDALTTAYTDTIVQTANLDQLFQDFLMDASKMELIKTYRFEDYLPETSQTTVLSSSTITQIDETDVLAITDTISNLALIGNQRFYLLDALNETSLDNEQLSIIASGVLGATLESPIFGFMFNQSQVLPTWGQTGINVRILRANQYDFSCYNPLNYTLNIQITKASDTSILFELVGYPLVEAYDVTIETTTSIPYGTDYIQNDALNETTPGIIVIDSDTETIYQLLIQPGVNGEILQIKRTITDPLGVDQIITLFYEQYDASNEIIEENSVDKEAS